MWNLLIIYVFLNILWMRRNEYFIVGQKSVRGETRFMAVAPFLEAEHQESNTCFGFERDREMSSEKKLSRATYRLSIGYTHYSYCSHWLSNDLLWHRNTPQF